MKNEHSRKFLDKGEIDIITKETLGRLLNNIKGKNMVQARSLVIALYYTGARPVEMFKSLAEDLKKQGRYIIYYLKASKRGLPRTVYLPYNNEFVKELYNYSISIFPKMLMFRDFKNNYTKSILLKSGEIKERIETSGKLRYYFNKWCDGVIDPPINPYFLRHNLFSSLTMQGVSDRDIKQLKGARSMESVRYYQHLSSASAKRVSMKLNKI